MKKIKRCHELGKKWNELVILPFDGKEYEEAMKRVRTHVMCRCELTKTEKDRRLIKR